MDCGPQVVVDNRGGASGRVGSDIVAKTVRDGYVLAMVSSTSTMLPGLEAKMRFGSRIDFSVVILATAKPSVLGGMLSADV